MKLNETKVSIGGLMRCCLDTIDTLDTTVDYPDGHIIDCKHETKGNKNIILKDGIWQWNR